MGQTKQKLHDGQPALGGWVMIGHPVVAELMAAEGFDWICVDMEHTATNLPALENLVRAVAALYGRLLAQMGDRA